MAPKPAAATAGGRESKSEGAVLLHAIDELQAGLPLLQQPHSDGLVLEVNGRLQAAALAAAREGEPVNLTPKQKKHLQKTTYSQLLCQIVELLSAYLVWTVPAKQEAPLPGTPAGAVRHTSASGSSNSTSGGGRGNRSAGGSRAASSSSSSGSGGRGRAAAVAGPLGASDAPPLAAAVTWSLLILKVILQKVLIKTPVAEPDMRSVLLTKHTGTLEALGAVARMQMGCTELQPYHLALCNHLFAAWGIASVLAFPLGSRSLRSNSDIWEQLPTLSEGLPALASLLHCYLRLPACMVSTTHDVAYIQMLMWQLQALLRSPAWGWTLQPQPSSSSSPPQPGDSHRREDEQECAAAAAAASPSSVAAAEAAQAGPVNQPADLDLDKLFWHIEHREPVEHFLWASIATATAALQAHPKVPRDADAPTPASSSSTSSSTSSSSSSSSSSNLSADPPEGAGYPRVTALLTWRQATAMFHEAAGMLHVLALVDTPRAQLADMHAAAMWSVQDPDSLDDLDPQDKHDIMRLWRGKAGFLWRPFLGQTCCTPDAVCDKMQDGSSSSSSMPAGSGSGSNSSSRPGGMTSTAATAPAAIPGDASSNINGSSSSSDVTAPSSCPGGSVQQRAHTLSAAVAAQWRILRSRIWQVAQGVLKLPDVTGDFMQLVQLLLLLVQHLQRASAQGAFLRTPAGSAVLQVLRQMWDTGEMGWMVVDSYLCDCFRQAAGVQAHEAPPSKWRCTGMTGHHLVHLLLVPGLLLQPAPPASIAPAAVHSNSSTSSSSSGAGRLQASGHSNSSGVAEGGHGNGSCGVCCAAPPGALGHTVVLSHAQTWVPVVVVPHAALQLPPGCTPPPAAFFLVEQLLRGLPSDSTMYVAVQLLRACIAWVAAPGRQQQQQQQQQGNPEVASQQAAAIELQRLAYCSLTSNVVQTLVHHPRLGHRWAAETELLVRSLLHAASEPASTQTSGEQAAGSSCAGTAWSLAASLATAVAAGAYTAHVLCVSVALDRTAAGGGRPDSSSSSSSSCADSWETASSEDEELESASGSSVSGEMAEVSPHPENCTLCYSAARQLVLLGRLERGSSEAPPALPKRDAAAFAEAAQRRGTTLQQYLQQQLQQLAWRHPVPGVCGNVLCGRLEGASAVGVVRGRVGTLCGGCRAVRYCCEGCQREAWAAHREVCGAGGRLHR